MVLFVRSRSQSRYDEVLESDSGLGLTLQFTLTVQKSEIQCSYDKAILSFGGFLGIPWVSWGVGIRVGKLANSFIVIS